MYGAFYYDFGGSCGKVHYILVEYRAKELYFGGGQRKMRSYQIKALNVRTHN